MEQIGNIIKAIETQYRGCKYRSRLEARWAVFFDEAEIRYEYEPEGFDLSEIPHIDQYLEEGDRYYLPDFWLPNLHVYAEIKPLLVPVNEIAIMKAHLLSRKHEVLIVYGEPGPDSYRVVSCRTGKEMPAPFFTPISRINRAYAAARSARF